MPGRPAKGAFQVAVLGPTTARAESTRVVLAATGPEPRPFHDLKALDLDALCGRVLEALAISEPRDAARAASSLPRRARRSDDELALDGLDDDYEP